MTAPAKLMIWFWQLWLAAIIFVFPIPHTVALRNLLLLVGVTVLLATLRGTARPQPPAVLKPAAWGLVGLTAWLVFHSLALAPSPTTAFDNLLRGDWLLPLLTAVLAAFAAARAGARQAILAVIAALLVHMLWMFVWMWLTTDWTGSWPAVRVPFGERDYHSSMNGFLLAILLAERLAAQSTGKRGALLPAKSGWVALLVSIAADVALRARNGTLITVFLLVVSTLWMAWRKPRFLLLLLVVAGLGGASVAFDPRWGGLKESLVVGWSSPSLYWLNGEKLQRPSTPSGADLEESAYARAAWARQAVEAIGKQPLGTGFGRDGFGRAIAEKYAQTGMVSSHSGWLDFALGAGLPGLVLLLLAVGLAIRGGWRQFRQHDDGAGLMLSFLVGSYMLRCLIDGHFSGWRLGLFAFLCGVLIAAMKRPQQEP